ncbi:MAG: DNA polymerase III subunit delta [Christensenellales bacterium]|nr:DNA polymerase III subunit delta [Christensenellales bacterium]
MDQWAFFDEFKAGTVRNVYLFYGPEAYIRKSARATMQKKLLMPGLESMNCTFMQSPSAQQIIENCETLPMMGDWRLVVVQGLELLESGKVKDEAQESAALCAYLSRVPQTTCLIFECETPDKRKKLCQTLMKLPGAVSFDTLSDARLAQWMNQTLKPLGKKMDAQACAQLAFTSGRDLTMLHGELQKLAAYAGDRTEITQEDIERIATHTAECTVFAMVDALVDGQAQQAFSLLSVLLESGEERLGVLALITRQYRQMMYAKDMMDSRMPQAQMMKALGVPSFALNKLMRRAGRRTMEQLRGQLELCVQTDYDIKRGAVREEAGLDRLMLALTGSM